MWLRLAHKFFPTKDSVWLVATLGLFFFSACINRPDTQRIDKLNDLSYAQHYRNLDSVNFYIKEQMRPVMSLMTIHYDDGEAERMNNQAFYYMAKMEYDTAEYLLSHIPEWTDNQIELLVCYVQQMRLCQRQSRNKDFYDYRERALEALKRINEERGQLSGRQQRRLLYAETELAIVTSTYYYYIGLEQQSIEALSAINVAELERDTAQLLNYLYNVGAGGIITVGTAEEINQQEFDHLLRCLLMARKHHYPYFVANSLEALAEHLIPDESRRQLLTDNFYALKFINTDDVPADELPLQLAEEALCIFQDYGDVYQIAGAYRTLASCARAKGNHEAALYYLHQALADTVVQQAPDLVASIREQLSVAYAAIDNKPMSDVNRNLYLDLQEQTRQDRYLEARASQFDQAVSQLNAILWAIVLAIVLLLLSLWFFTRLHKRRHHDGHLEQLLEPLKDWQQQNEKRLHEQQDTYEELGERLALGRLHVGNNERRLLEQRAKVSLVLSVVPFIDRIIHEVGRLKEETDGKHVSDPQTPLASQRLEYIRELTEKINEYNQVLTHWVQLRQGELSIRVETFPLQPLFDMVAKSKTGFQLKGITLRVNPTRAVVKADRVLTLFMLNTLADNARKFTPAGGTVDVSATERDDYVEVSVSDTGVGMDEQQLVHVFEHTGIIDGSQPSHGFGLLNCRGIIEKYRKMSKLFSVCLLSAESQKGRGSRFSFRLPKGVQRAMLFVLGVLLPFAGLKASDTFSTVDDRSPLDRAHVYADSAYFSNVDGRYEQTLFFADSCRRCLNEYYRTLFPDGADTLSMTGVASQMPADVKWLHERIGVNYDVILDMRNEVAVAALSLHEWQLYQYNNKIYTQLYKEKSADASLNDYCRKMQQSQTNRTVAVILLVILLFAIITAYYLLYERHQLYYRFCMERIKAINAILLSDASVSEKLERMAPMTRERYPSPLQDIVERIQTALRQYIEADAEQHLNMELAEDELRRTELENANLHVANAVLDNCLSTLKHETMYYPSRILQLVTPDRDETVDTHALKEVVAYYRDLYAILSTQAMKQVEHYKLHLKRLHDDILGDENLIAMLFELLAKQQGNRIVAMSASPKDTKYVVCRVPMPSLSLTEEQAQQLFDPAIGHIPYLLCRQIVRDHGEATNRRGCSIRAEVAEGQTTIIITLPRIAI